MGAESHRRKAKEKREKKNGEDTMFKKPSKEKGQSAAAQKRVHRVPVQRKGGGKNYYWKNTFAKGGKAITVGNRGGEE